MNKLGAVKAAILLTFLILGFFVGSKVIADDHPKPESVIEFGISKHGGLHYVNGGFSKFKLKSGKQVIAGIKDLYLDVDINSLWTWQADTVANDDVNRTIDLLSDSWFNVEKFPKAHASFKFLPFNNAKKVPFGLTIKGIKKNLVGYVKDGYFYATIVLKDFKIDASWKRIFVGNFASLKVKLGRKI